MPAEKKSPARTWRTEVRKEGTIDKKKDKKLAKTIHTSCPWCGTQLWNVNTPLEYEVVDKLANKSTIKLNYEVIEKDVRTAHAKFKKLGLPTKEEDLSLPIKCSFVYKEMKNRTATKCRITAQYTYSIAKELSGHFPCQKDICPCCGKNIKTVEKDFEKSYEKEYSSLVKRPKIKTNTKKELRDESTFDVKEYLSVLIDLYKESYTVESQLSHLIKKRNLSKRDMDRIKSVYIFQHLRVHPKKYMSVEKKLKELTETDLNAMVLTPEEETEIWTRYMEDNPELSISAEDLDTPIEPKVPIKPIEPPRPERPQYQTLDESMLIKPDEPIYLVGNIFTKKSVERKNAALKEEYDTAFANYEAACKTKEYNSVLEYKYKQECVAYEASIEEYKRAYSQYEVQYNQYTIDYNNYLLAVELYNSKKEEIKEKEKQVSLLKKELFSEALKEKKNEHKQEIKKLSNLLSELENTHKENTVAEANVLPEVCASEVLCEFIDGEVNNLLDDLSKLYSSIKEMLELDVIYPKYRDFEILCTFYDYFLSGRTDSLSGPYGAYNLYESESRADIVISKIDSINERLDDIISKLDEIQSNQLVLHDSVKEVKTSIDKLDKHLDKISKGVFEIRDTIKDAFTEPPASSSSYVSSSSSYRSISSSSSTTPLLSTTSSHISSLPSYSSYSSFASRQRSLIGGTVNRASVVSRGIIGGIVAGPVGAIVGALSAADHNRRL